MVDAYVFEKWHMYALLWVNAFIWSWHALWCSCSVSWGGSHAFVQGELHWFRGACMCAGGALCGFRVLVWWFALFAWAWFCLGCVEPLPLPKGSETCLLRWSFSLPLFAFRSLVGVSFYSFLLFFFSLVLLFVGVVNALIKREIEDHVWFEDRWMVASWCDEWLTTLCGLILG
jgi:hypothetical protein